MKLKYVRLFVLFTIRRVSDGLNTPGNKIMKRINAGSANVASEKLLRKLKDETTVLGNLKIKFKNFITKKKVN
jgi:biofilm PGA synthesis lipoprotein PgaB